VGWNVEQFHARLDLDANYLSQFGAVQSDIVPLVNFELARANNYLPAPTLASVVDAASPAPGIPLIFSRQYLQPISGRYRLGGLGRGWVDNWEVSLAADNQGNVTISEGGQPRGFIRKSDGSYQGAAGDYGQLTLSSGVYTLREKNNTTLSFTAQGRLDFIQDTNGNKVTASYTGSLLTSLSSSDGGIFTIAYNAAGRVQNVTDAAGQITTYTYDAANEHLLSVAGPGGTTSYTYITGQGIAQEHALASITFPDGTHEYFSYDGQGRLVGTSRDGGADPVQYAYTSPGGVTMTDASGASTTLLFNEFGSLQMVIDPLGHTIQSQYDASQNLTQITTGAGTTYHYAYDKTGNLVRQVDPLGDVVAMTYSPGLNQLTSIADGEGNLTKYAYSSSGNLTSTTYADGSTTGAAYNALGLPTTTTDARAQAISYQYNAGGQVVTATFADGTQQSFKYDAIGNLLSMKDATGTTIYTYDGGNRLKGVTYPSGQALLYSYDSGGRRSRLVDSTSGFAVNYNYDVVGRLQSLTDAGGTALVTYKYDLVGRLTEQDNANGTYSSHAYDAAGNLLHLTNYGPGGATQSRFDYTYDALNQRTTEATLDGAWTYTYDAAGQLTHAVFTSTNPAIADQDLTYVYDAAGNRVKTITNGTTARYTTNTRNEYTTVEGTTYKYDADGNLVSQTDAPGTTSFTYSSLNEVTQVVTPNDTWSYQYNAIGERVAANHNGQSITYVLDPTGIGNVIAAYDGSGHVVADYAYGLGLVSQTRLIGTDYYQFDASGSTSRVTSASGSIENSYDYLPFGQVAASTEAVNASFQFAGQFGIVSGMPSNLQFMRARAYEADTGRFISQDPLGSAGGQNSLYAYAANSPVDAVDVTGLWVVNIGGTFHLGGGGSINVSIGSGGAALTVGGGVGLDAGGGIAVDLNQNAQVPIQGATSTTVNLGLGFTSGSVSHNGDGSYSATAGLGAGEGISVDITKTLWSSNRGGAPDGSKQAGTNGVGQISVPGRGGGGGADGGAPVPYGEQPADT
jgi:RHS repeat-associated protein